VTALRRLVAIAVLPIVCLLLPCAEAWAQPAPVAIIPFNGLHADEPQSVVVRMLKKRAQLVPAADVGGTAAQVVVTGTVEHPEGKLQLVVSALSIKSGDVVGQLTFPIPKTRHLDREQLKQLAMQVNELVNQALTKVAGENAPAPEPPPAEEEAEAAAEAAVAQANDTENVPLDITDLSQAQLRQRPRSASPLGPRPRWAPLFDGAVGVVISGRSLSIAPTPSQSYSPGSGGGIHLDANLYPLSFFWKKWKGVLAGLGAGLTLDVPFWPNTQAQNDNPGAPGSYPTHELRVEGGARWKFTLHKSIPRFELALLLGAGKHNYSIQRLGTSSTGYVDVGPPNVGYVFGAFGLQARLHVREWASAWVAFSYEYVPDAGHIEDAVEYGYANTWGLHLRGGVDVYLWKGLKAGVSAYWERFSMEFTHGQPTPYKEASHAVDNFYGGSL